MVEAVYFFYMWFIFGSFQGYDFHNCSMSGDPNGPLEVTCSGPPHTHEPIVEAETPRIPRSIRTR